MRTWKFLSIIGVGLFAMSSPALAQDDAPAPPAEPPPADAAAAPANAPVEPAPAAAAPAPAGNAKYGNAGCGLGSLLFSPSDGFTQVFAATTNGTSGSQTFGISSGTSNCDGAGYQPGSTAAFIQTNRAALAKDIARGKGPTVTGLAELAGCNNAQAVGHALQKNFKNIFSGPQVDDKQVSSNVIGVLKSDSALACGHLG